MADKTIVVRIVGDSGQFVSAMGTAGASVNGFGNQAAAGANKATASVNKLGKTAATVGKITTLGVAAGLALSAKAAIDFESAFAGVRKTINASESGFAILRQDLRDLALEIPISVNELARIAELGGQLGVGIGGIPEFVEVIGEIGATTNLSTEQAALGFARLDNILGLSQQNFRQLGSTIVDLGNNFAATEDEILTFSLRIAPVAATVGITADEVLAISTAFASVGVPAERGGTAVQKALIKISEAALDGGKELRIFARTAGVTVEEFQRLQQEDPAKAFTLFITGLQRVRKEGKSAFQVLDSVGLGSARVTQSLLALSSAEGVLAEALETGNRAWETNIALTEEAEKRFSTTASKIELAKNQLQDTAITIGDRLIPVIGDLADGFSDFIAGVESATPVIKAFLAVILGGVAGATIANTAYKVLSKTIGVDLVLSMGAAGFAATALKIAIGGGLLVVLGFAISAITNFGQQQQDAKLRVDALAEAIDNEARGMEGLTKATIKNQIVAEGYLQSFNRIGIGLDTFADAILGDAEALEIVQRRMSEFETTARNTRDEIDKGFELDRDSFSGDDVKEAEESLSAYNIVLGLLRSNLDEYALAQQQVERENRALGESMDLDAQAKGFDGVNEAMKESALSGEVLGSSLGYVAEAAILADNALDGVEDAVMDYADSLDEAYQETEDNLRSQIDLWGEMGDAVSINVDKIIENVNQQLQAQGQFQEAIMAFDVSDPVQAMLDEWSLETQAGFVNLGQEDREKLIEYMETVFGPAGNIAQTAIGKFNADLPDLIKEGGAVLLSELKAVADQVASETDANPVEAWLGTIEAAIATAPAELRPGILSAIQAAFSDPGTFGLGQAAMQGLIDGIRAMYPEIAAAASGAANTVTTRISGDFVMQSPSRVMRDLGEMVGAGFIQGVNDGFEGLHSVGAENMGIPSRHQLVAGSSTNVTTNSSTQDINLTINGSKNTGEDSQALLLAANLIGAA